MVVFLLLPLSAQASNPGVQEPVQSQESSTQSPGVSVGVNVGSVGTVTYGPRGMGVAIAVTPKAVGTVASWAKAGAVYAAKAKALPWIIGAGVACFIFCP